MTGSGVLLFILFVKKTEEDLFDEISTPWESETSTLRNYECTRSHLLRTIMPRWLPLTMTWLYEQVYRLPMRIAVITYCASGGPPTLRFMSQICTSWATSRTSCSWSHRFKKKAGITLLTFPFYEQYHFSGTCKPDPRTLRSYGRQRCIPSAKKRGLPLLVTFLWDGHPFQLPRRLPPAPRISNLSMVLLCKCDSLRGRFYGP